MEKAKPKEKIEENQARERTRDHSKTILQTTSKVIAKSSSTQENAQTMQPTIALGNMNVPRSFATRTESLFAHSKTKRRRAKAKKENPAKEKAKTASKAKEKAKTAKEDHNPESDEENLHPEFLTAHLANGTRRENAPR